MEQKQPLPIGRLIVLGVLAVIAIVFGIMAARACADPKAAPAPSATPLLATAAPTPSPTPSPTPTPEPTPWFETPAAVASTGADAMGYRRELELNGERVESYTRANPLSFGQPEEYAALEGVLTFRGDNHRTSAAYGTIAPAEKKLKIAWTAESGSMQKGISSGGEGSWTGSGWVGQPLLVKWPAATKAIMNMTDEAKADDTLIEAIYATMDGNVYFLNAKTGKPTREKLRIGMPFKGAGSLDPRGYPILYLGSGEGYSSDERDTRAMAYSLIDFTRLYEFGKREDDFSLRDWHAYDSAPLVDAAADTLIYPGENGILYSVVLNTKYDEAAGTLSMNPSEVLKYRYGADRTQNRTGKNSYWLGYEGSAAIWGHHAYLPDNAGILQCIDLNTMDITWVADTLDDTNGSPILEEDEENHRAYLYVGASLHWRADGDGNGQIGFFKFDAVTGETIWAHMHDVRTVSGVSGGIQATAVLGKGNISDLVIVPIARTPSRSTGVLLALDKETGSVVWQFDMEKYAWSSPIALYEEDGTAYIVQCDTGGHIYLLDGRTGTLLDTLTFEGGDNFEASPAAYGDMIVIGSRSAKIYGIEVE